jgi:hypothetical protein
MLVANLAPAAQAGGLDARAGAEFSPYTRGGEIRSQSATSSAAAANYGNANGVAQATAVAHYGSLGATAEINVANLANLDPGGYFYHPLAGGNAEFWDKWWFTDRPLDTEGAFRVSFHLEGAASADPGPLPSIGVSSGQLTVTIRAHDRNDSEISAVRLWSGYIQQRAVNAVYVSDPVSFRYGREVDIVADLIASAEVTCDQLFLTGEANAHFGNTATLSRVEVRDANGNWTDAFALTTESGATYPFQAQTPSAVPEPSAGLLMLVLSAAVAATRRRPLPSLRTLWRRRGS